MSGKVFVCDFETTVFEGQLTTEVWASACVEMWTEEVHIFHSIGEQFDYFCQQKTNIIAYYHNLKFDGAFWLSYLLRDLGYKQATNQLSDKDYDLEFKKVSKMENKTFKYSISDRGQWYSITIKVNGKIIELRDSLKLLPFSVKKIGNSFGTKHKKLDMEYKGFRYAGCNITDEEKQYISNDVLVVKEALEIMFKDGHNKLTIGSCCLAEFKKGFDRIDYDNFFPDLYCEDLDSLTYGAETQGKYIRKSYKGGWCYLVEGKENKIFELGTTADVNSLYPSMMHSESGNYYPVGKPMFWKGNYIPDKALGNNKYYFVRIKTRFYIKPGYLPFIQLKGNLLYPPTKSLTTSDVYDKETNKYYSYITNLKGEILDTRVEMTLTMTDYELLKEHYELVDFEILDGCYFFAEIGLFDNYINKYKEIKIHSKGAQREEAKLFLNNLYGKMASSTDSSFKYAIVKDDGSIGFISIQESNKQPGYIPIGSAITSYARNFTIRAAQKNYHGVDKHGFIYADTDSIHCDLKPDELIGVPVHDTDFCHWKLESCWDKAIFVRQKTYIEHIIKENLKPVPPYNNIKCAGMPEKCKDLFEQSMSCEYKERSEYNEDEIKFLYDKNDNKIKREYSDFKVGIKIPGKLRPKRIPGGVLLVETTYEMR